jgi:hypothetical protein
VVVLGDDAPEAKPFFDLARQVAKNVEDVARRAPAQPLVQIQ